MATAQIPRRVGNITNKPLRTLCDTSSQVNMITKACVKYCSLPTFRSPSQVIGFYAQGAVTFNRKIKVWLLSRFQYTKLISITFTVVPNILPQAIISAPHKVEKPTKLKTSSLIHNSKQLNQSLFCSALVFVLSLRCKGKFSVKCTFNATNEFWVDLFRKYHS